MLGLFGAGAASAAPDVDGMTYEDAVAAIEEDGGIPKVSVTAGSRQDAMGACLVTRVLTVRCPADRRRRVLRPDEGDVLLTLNCNRGAATATTPGASAASPCRAATSQPKAEEAAAAAQNEEDELADAGELPGVPGQVAE